MTSIGTKLGPYEITGKLGEGGMGEVYRATDTKLDRQVAIKVLPAAFTGDPDRLARFEREAKLLAQLQHPNIASIFGLEEAGGTRALVMELVEGPTLAERLAAGPLSIDESLAIACQIAEALEEAHEKGIIHRDLKPQNVKAPVDGKVKVLDFGLAKAMDPAGAASGAGSASQLAASPTLTLGATVQGMILGTAAYMAPEQAKGLAVDKRADIWAFGVVLYEMLTGARLFVGDSVPETLAGVLKSEVDLDHLPDATPPALRRLLRRCLERNQKNRLHDIADARIVIAEVERGGEDATPVYPPGAPAEVRGAARQRWAGLGLLVLGALAGLVVAGRLAPAGAPLAEYHVLSLEQGYIYSARFAPDGTSIVYGEARGASPVALYSTRSDATVSRPLDVPGADVVGIAANGEMALILDRHHLGSWLRVGTLARAALAGGAPRALLEDIYDADITSDGTAFAVVRGDGAGQRLEYPVGTVLYRTDGWISAPRISRDGRRVAFADHSIAGDDQGFVTVVEPGQTPRKLSESINFLQGIAWSADGREVVASYGSPLDGGYVAGFTSEGTRRVLLRTVTSVRVQDVAPSGAILLTGDSYSLSVEGRLAGGEVDLGASPTAPSIDGISDDGEIVVGSNVGRLMDGEYRVSYRRRNGPEIDLAAGGGAGVTPDGHWAFFSLTRDPNKLHAMPTGPGDPRVYDLGDIEPLFGSGFEPLTFTANGETAAFLGQRPGEGTRGFVFDLAGSKPPRAATPMGVHLARLSPDGRSLVAANAEGILGQYSIDSGERSEIPGAIAGEIPLSWSSASDAIFVWDQTIPARLERLDLLTGARSLAVEWEPTGSAQGLYGLLKVSTDARYFLMRFRSARSSLVVAQGAG